MSEPRFQPGERVRVQWLTGPVEATVVELLLWNDRPHKMPHYRLALDGVDGFPGFREDEIEPVGGAA